MPDGNQFSPEKPNPALTSHSEQKAVNPKIQKLEGIERPFLTELVLPPSSSNVVIDDVIGICHTNKKNQGHKISIVWEGICQELVMIGQDNNTRITPANPNKFHRFSLGQYTLSAGERMYVGEDYKLEFERSERDDGKPDFILKMFSKNEPNILDYQSGLTREQLAEIMENIHKTKQKYSF